jgi:FkbM family methyltransferase
MLLLKKMLKKETDNERAAIFEKLAKIQKVKIKFRGKELTLLCNSRTFSLIHQVFVRNQYDLGESVIKNKIILDIGANVGDSSLFCAFFEPKLVYAFEPMQHSFDILQKNIAINSLQKVIIPIKKGCSSKNEFVSVLAGVDASIGNIGKTNEENAQIELVTIDDFLGNSRVDLIKIDIEGHEEAALLGAQKTIQKFKPVLTFSAYHKQSDKVRLPEVVASIRNDYRIKLNKFYEEDFFCD